jgi:HK97 family phage major capsid protein
VSALTRVAKSYAADAVIDLGDFLTNEMAYAFAVKEDDCLFNGDGTDTYGGIYGIRAKIIDGNHTAGAIDADTDHDTLAEITADDLHNCSGALPDFAGINPAWYTSRRGNALVFDALKAAGGGNTITDLAGAPVRQWLGDRIVISQSMPKVTTDLSNVAMLIYGDLSMGAVLGDRMGMEVDILNERYAEYRQIGVMATERMDIVVHGLGDTSAAGPIVALIGE